jgi:SAM-dependent methyltransferase
VRGSSPARTRILTTDLYDHPALYDSLFPATAHIAYYRDLARRQGGEVLELACGTGQLAVPIAAAGLPVTGLDLSPAMLTTARDRAAAADVSMECVQGDMRRFDLGRRFALIFVARNSLLHLCSTEDFVAAFRAVRRHLAPDGIFAFDIFNPDVRILALPAGQRFPVMNVETESFGLLSVEGIHNYDSGTQVNHGTWYVSTAETPDAWVFPIVVRSIFPQELPLLLAAGGFHLTSRFGDLSGEPFGSVSRQQVCLCEAASPDPET